MPVSSTVPRPDLPSLASLYGLNSFRPRDLVAVLGERLAAYADPAVWIHTVPAETLRAQAESLERRRADGELLPLYGVPFAVKDNIDVAGLPTTAACPAFAYTAAESASVVRRLQEAGALLVGKTNLDQFACGLAGDRSPFGACRNVFQAEFTSGGSSSGSAVAVAAGLVSFALGTDTAGSGRVPAGCNNIVGLKPTPGLLSTAGIVPACRSLDCVSLLALTVADAHAVLAVLRGADSHDLTSRNGPATFAVPRDSDLEFFGDREQEALFRESTRRLEQMGSRRLGVDFTPFREVAGLLYEGPWLAERLSGIGDFFDRCGDALHPVTRAVLQGGAAVTGVDVFKGLERLRQLREVCLRVFEQAEVLVVPTMPTIPTLAQVRADSVGWSRRLGCYTNFANLLRMPALALPAGFTPRGLPGSITLLGPPGSDERLVEFGAAWQQRLNLPLGATGLSLPARARLADAPRRVAEGTVRVSVAGAHLRGQPLHPALRATGARFVRACATAPRYRFMAFMDLAPPRPGLLRVEDAGASLKVEVYDLPVEGFGRLVASVAPPLAIGTVELADGEAVKGFLCESWAAARARDITPFGGWVAFLEAQRLPSGPPP